MKHLGILTAALLTTGLVSLAETPPASAPAPQPAPPFLAGKTPLFQPITVDPAVVRQSMQARSELDDLNRRIQARQSRLYEDDASIKELQAQMRELQKKIDALLAQDAELTALKKKFEALAPDIPMGIRMPFPTNAPTPAP